MAAPTLTLLAHTELHDADTNTGWFNLTTADTDLKVEGTGSMSGVTRADGDDSYYDAGGAPVTAAGKTLRGWVNTTNMPYMQPIATNPYDLWCYDSSTQSNSIAMFGSDTYFGGWFYIWQDMDAFTGVTLANVDRWGIEAGHSGNSKNVVNMWMDVLRYLDGYSMTGGTSGDKVTLADIETADRGTTTLYGYGIVQETNGVYFCTGDVQFGTGATTHYFEMDGEVLIFVDPPGSLSVASGLYSLSGVGSGTNIDIKNSVIKSAGITDATRFAFDFDDSGIIASNVSITDNLIVRAAASAFKTSETVTSNTFDDCGQITHGGADLSDCIVKNYEGTAGTAAVTYNVNVDPDGEMDNMEFTKGTAATHAVEFGSSTPSNITLRGWTVTSYNTGNGNNDSVIYNNTGGALTVNIVGGSGTFSYRNGTSATTSIVQNPVTLTVTAQTTTGTKIQNARCFVLAGNTAGGLPYHDSVTITRASSTATVSHTSHGFSTGQKVFITGTGDSTYFGSKTITVTTADAYTYTVTGTPADPTGCEATAVIIDELTTAQGVADDTRTYSVDQDIDSVRSWVRKSSSADNPKYVTAAVAGTISSSAGLSLTIQMIEDE